MNGEKMLKQKDKKMATQTEAERDMTETLYEEEAIIIDANELREVMSDEATGGPANSQNGWVMVTTSDVKETQATQNDVEKTASSSETEEMIGSGGNGEMVHEGISGDENTGYTVSKERQYVYIVCLHSDRRPGCKIGFVWGKGFCLNDKLIPLNNIRFVSKKHRLDRPPQFATSIVLSYTDSNSSPAEIKHLFLEMNTIKQTNELFKDFIRLFEDKFAFSDDWDASVSLAAYSMACKQPLYYCTSDVRVTNKRTDKGRNQCINCAVITDIECMALYPLIGNGDLGKPYLLMFSAEEEEMRVENVHHDYEAETIVFKTKLYTFKMAASSELVSVLCELTPKPRNLLTDPAVLRRFVKVDHSGYHLTLLPPVIRSQSTPKETVMTRFLREIDAAMKQCENDVDFSADWLAVAASLTTVANSGEEPESEPFTTVLPWMDASYPIHVRQILNGVVEELVNQRYQNALSSVQAARRFVENQTAPEVKDIFKDPDTAVLRKLFFWNLVFGKPRSWSGQSTTVSNMSEWNRKKLMKDISARLEDAVVRCEGNEDVQVYWVSLEADLNVINELVREDWVPYLDDFSRDYDANNPLHLEHALDEIAQRLKEEDYAVALAKLKAAERVFGKSETPEIARFFQRTDLDILKMLYCSSVVTEDNVLETACQEEGEVAQTRVGWPHRPVDPPALGATGPVSGLITVEEQTRKQMRTLTGDLDDAMARSADNEDLQMYWIVLEADLKDIIDRGTVPETDADSGGMNPEDPGHLKQALADVSDHLKKERLSIALSRLQATRQLFCQSRNSHIREFFDTDDFTILKKLYFRALME